MLPLHTCGVKHAPRAVLLEELTLSPLQVFWWQQNLEFWNTIAAGPVGTLFHIISLFMMPFMWGVVLPTFLAPLPFACSLFGIPCHAIIIAASFLIWRVTPLLRLCTNTYRAIIVMLLEQPCLLGLSAAFTISGLDLLASAG